MKESGTSEHALLTSHKTQPQVRCRPLESNTLDTLRIIICSSFVSFHGWLPIFLACHWNAEGQRIC
uniref:Uncharacterized protein n=1 Tax=Mesocestoides corti TaxID=53468 RepID=A0A5K3FZ01_MESCO